MDSKAKEDKIKEIQEIFEKHNIRLGIGMTTISCFEASDMIYELAALMDTPATEHRGFGPLSCKYHLDVKCHTPEWFCTDGMSTCAWHPQSFPGVLEQLKPAAPATGETDRPEICEGCKTWEPCGGSNQEDCSRTENI